MSLETTKMVEIYQEIAMTLNDIIPEEWAKVFVYAEVREDATKVGFYYYPVDQDKPVHVLEITELFEVNEEYIDQLRYKLYDCFEELWNEFIQNDQDVWTNLTFILERTGQFKIDFDYADLSEVDDFERQVIWRYKYLGIEPLIEQKRARQIFENYLEQL